VAERVTIKIGVDEALRVLPALVTGQPPVLGDGLEVTLAPGSARPGAVGTVCLETVQYLKYRRKGGKDNPLAWEFAPVDSWEKAPDPGQVAKRLTEGFTRRELPDRWGGGYGILAGSLRRPHALYGLPFVVTAAAGGWFVAGCSAHVSIGETPAVPKHTVETEVATTLARQENQPVPKVVCPG
jgi:hypothetical protein